MKWLTIPTVAALSLVVASPALAALSKVEGAASRSATTQIAQRDQDRDQDRTRTRDQRSNQRQDQRNVRQPAQRNVAPQQRNVAPLQPRDRRDVQRNNQRFNWGQYRQGQAPSNWSQHPRLDLRAWQRNERAQHRYRWDRYNRPQGWYYRQWTFGMVLPLIFWSRDYWITDYWQYGLMDPPYGFVWVRYGSDAILVNVSNGYILRVVYGLYY